MNIIESKVEPHKAINKGSTTVVQGKTKTQTNCNYDIKYFRCLGNGYLAS